MIPQPNLKVNFFPPGVSVVMVFILSPQVLGCLVFTKDWFQDKVCLILNQVQYQQKVKEVIFNLLFFLCKDSVDVEFCQEWQQGQA